MAAEAGWDLLKSAELSSDERAWMDRARRTARRLSVLAAFAVGLGLILIGIGNGIWRLTALSQIGDPGGLLAFLFHLATAATVVVLGASLLPLALHGHSEEPVPLEKPALLFAALWIVIGGFQLVAGQAQGGEAIGGSIVLMLAGAFGLLAVHLYDPELTGPSLSAGVLGLVAGGLLIGGVATVPGSIIGSSRLGSELVFRYGEALHVSGYLVAVLAATVYPFVRSQARGRTAVLLGACAGGLVWGLGEVVFAAWWLAGTPWTLFGGLTAGGSVGYAFVLAGGLATVIGGVAVLGASAAATGYAGLPLAASLSSHDREGMDASPEPARQRACPACGAQVTTGRTACPGCGHDLAQP